MPKEPPDNRFDAIGEGSPENPVPDKEAEREEGAFRRKELIANKVFGWGVWIIRAVAVGFLITFAIRLGHLILPAGMRWLSAEDLQGIDKIIFSGALGGFVGRFFDKIAR